MTTGRRRWKERHSHQWLAQIVCSRCSRHHYQTTAFISQMHNKKLWISSLQKAARWMNGWWNLHSSEREKWFASAEKKAIKMQWRWKRRWSEANCLRLARKQFVTKHRALSAVICEELKASDHERFVIKIFERLSREKAPKVHKKWKFPWFIFFIAGAISFMAMRTHYPFCLILA